MPLLLAVSSLAPSFLTRLFALRSRMQHVCVSEPLHVALVHHARDGVHRLVTEIAEVDLRYVGSGAVRAINDTKRLVRDGVSIGDRAHGE